MMRSRCLAVLMALAALAAGVTPLDAQVDDGSVIMRMHSTRVRRAVVIGVSTYQNIPRANLNYAHADANAFADLLEKVPGPDLLISDSANVVRLINEKATLTTVTTALSKLLKESRPGDIAVIYFAGHGDVDTTTLRQDGYLLFTEAPANQMYPVGGSLSVKQLDDLYITQMVDKGVKVVLVTDACRSGNFVSESTSGSRQTISAIASVGRGEVVRFASSAHDELSYEGRQYGSGHGAFTYFLIKAMEGAARPPNDTSSVIDADKVIRFVRDSVTRRTARRQTPQTNGDSRTVMSIVPAPPRPPQPPDGDEPHSDGAMPAPDDLEAIEDIPPLAPQAQSGDSLSQRFLRDFAAALARRVDTTARSISSRGEPPSAVTIYFTARRIGLPARVTNAMADSLTIYYKGDAQRIIAEYQTGAISGHSAAKVASAAHNLRNLPLVAPGDPDSARTAAKRQFLAGYAELLRAGYDRAIVMLDSATRADDRVAPYFEALGRAYIAVRDYGNAAIALRAAITRAPRWERPATYLAQIESSSASVAQQRLQSLTDVSSAYDSSRVQGGVKGLLVRQQTATADNAGWSPRARFYRDSARLLVDSDRYAAERLYIRAINIDSTNGSAFAELGAFYATQGQWQSASKAYAAAVRYGPVTPALLARFGDAQLRLQKTDSARDLYRAALQRDSTYPVALLGLGSVASLRGEAAASRQWLNFAYTTAMARGFTSTASAAADGLAHYWVATGRPDSAIVYWQRVLRSLPPTDSATRADILVNLGAAHGSMNQSSLALGAYGQARSLQRGLNDAWGEVTTLSAIAVFTYRSSRGTATLARALAYFDTAEVARRRAQLLAAGSMVPDDTTLRRQTHEAWVLAWSSPAAMAIDSMAPYNALAVAELARLDPYLQGRLPDTVLAAVSRTALASSIRSALRAARRWQVVYFTTSDTLLRWVVTPNGGVLPSAVTARRGDVARLVRGADREAIVNGPRLVEMNGSLSRLLFPPELAPAFQPGARITVLPHDALFGVRFLSLPVPGGAGGAGDVVSIQGQATLVSVSGLQASVGRPLVAPAELRSLMSAGGGDIVGPERGQFFTPRSIRFAQTIGPVLRSQAFVRGAEYAGTIIHITSRPGAPDPSMLLFGPAGKTDSLVTAGDILRGGTRYDGSVITLDAPLAATGSLPRAFLATGAAAVIAPITDDSGLIDAELRRFYHHWLRSDIEINDALRRARADLGPAGGSLLLFVPAPLVRRPGGIVP